MGKIAIGSAQFGLNYGVTNSGGQATRETISRILNLGWRRGCRWLDTAAAYGEAEIALGATTEAAPFRVSTKVGARLDLPAASLEAEFAQSVRRLQRERPDVLLLHRSEWLHSPHAREVMEWGNSLRATGRVGAFGVSIYSPAELSGLDLKALDWVQIPLSILAQEWLTGGHLDRLRDAGIRIQLRSVLAQGLIAADPEHLPPPLITLREPLKRLRAAACEANVSPLQLALAFVLQLPIELAVVGVESPEQLGEIMDCETLQLDLPWKTFACSDVTALDPRTWPQSLRIDL